MKELQAKAKVTQTMTRDGLVVENQADGTVENVSSREAEQDYSTDSEGKTEKILERTEDVKDKHKAKKKAKQAAETAESEDGLHGSAARLELTEEERADPALQPYIQKAGAKADKLDAARAALPIFHHRFFCQHLLPATPGMWARGWTSKSLRMAVTAR